MTFSITKRNRYILVALFIFLGLLLIFALVAGSNTKKIDNKKQIQNISITESECKDLLNQFYSFVVNKPFEKTQLAKEVLEQYFENAGISINKSNPSVRYTLPSSQCGKTLDGLLIVMSDAQRKNQ